MVKSLAVEAKNSGISFIVKEKQFAAVSFKSKLLLLKQYIIDSQYFWKIGWLILKMIVDLDKAKIEDWMSKFEIPSWNKFVK